MPFSIKQEEGKNTIVETYLTPKINYELAMSLMLNHKISGENFWKYVIKKVHQLVNDEHKRIEEFWVSDTDIDYLINRLNFDKDVATEGEINE
ncbi:MAG: hypothetical protein F6K40_32980 [Okeania sp. SIO3I5]|uniref:hypothetical protein n=1 Tax=Okeania sp. SIO3I5 TaxID=2607805 RepID=UPI0013BBFA64|nr:hypothetical protein [Okeania sp. SIO3I5]NEQ40778.1 hypothetical protein [Okeania sp. SIO3I5]